MKQLQSVDARRLEKVLILAEQKSDDKAIAAFLLAQQMMRKFGLSFGNILQPHDTLSALVCQSSYSRLQKILSLSASDKQGESIAAFLMARRLMRRLGLTFKAIIDFGVSTAPDSYTNCYPTVDVEVAALRKQVSRLKAELAEKSEKLRRYEIAFQEVVDNALVMHQTQNNLITADGITH